MLKKKSFYVMTLIIGIVLFSSSFLFRGEELKTIAGVLIGIGAGLFGMSIANLGMTLITVGGFLLYNVISLYYMNKYQKEM